jgi:hypothetical protein
MSRRTQLGLALATVIAVGLSGSTAMTAAAGTKISALQRGVSIQIKSPSNGATVAGTVTVAGTASSGYPITSVTLAVDAGTPVPVSGTTSWSYAWDTTTVANGSHTLTARATNSKGRHASTSVSVTVQNSTPTPSPSPTPTPSPSPTTSPSPSPSPSPTGSSITGLGSTADGIHVGMVFNSGISDPSVETGKFDLVWGSNWATEPAGMYNMKYIPFDREPDATHSISWWQANHPDWVEYQCDKTTPAWEFGNPVVPLDITNPAVRDWLWQTYIQQPLAAGYSAVAFDNVNLHNAWGHRCGHYDQSGTWVQQFTGTSGDPAYVNAILAWASAVRTMIKSAYPNVGIAMNFAYDFDQPTASYQLAQYMDIDLDERGGNNGGRGSMMVPSDWSTNMSYWNWLASQGKGLFIIDAWPSSFSSLTNGEVNWSLANYLLTKGTNTYIAITGDQYGGMYWRNEYSAAIGTPTTAMYQSQGAYMRDFTNGRAIVNTSMTQSLTITLPSGTYKDLYGNAVNSVTLAPDTAIVLLG